MNYTKPEVTPLGSAALLIESSQGKQLGSQDGSVPKGIPAYDLDE